MAPVNRSTMGLPLEKIVTASQYLLAFSMVNAASRHRCARACWIPGGEGFARKQDKAWQQSSESDESSGVWGLEDSPQEGKEAA
ncbi:hypothetical protein JZ751_001805 [Albula glossodonta]|uniref:Uncharacterized protein n=1 Tax=Albula glossodonta TaxID=121402 RepID=A0A8T2PUE5_9TELE|nr:hypothetical protein JZ751_001805 [Albula glossodonta]